MAEKFRDWVEPAHPGVVRQFEDLVRIYRLLQRELQPRVDEAFDRASSRIGFVVTTTLPVTLRVGAKEGAVEGVAMPRALATTVFAEAFEPILKELGQRRQPEVAPGTHALYLIWHQALRLKLAVDWVEPAHLSVGRLAEVAGLAGAAAVRAPPEVKEPAHWRDAGLESGALAGARVRPEVIEPAHWFDEAGAIAEIDQVIIAALDEVYTDLHLGARIQAVRQEARLRAPFVSEPAHFRQLIEEVLERLTPPAAIATPAPQAAPTAPRSLADLMQRPDGAQLVAELVSVLRKYGA